MNDIQMTLAVIAIVVAVFWGMAWAMRPARGNYSVQNPKKWDDEQS